MISATEQICEFKNMIKYRTATVSPRKTSSETSRSGFFAGGGDDFVGLFEMSMAMATASSPFIGSYFAIMEIGERGRSK